MSVVQFLDLDLDTDLKKKLVDLIKITEDKSKILRKTRDKFIAHKDLDVAEHKINIHDPGFTIHDIADILDSIGNILRCIYMHFSGKNDIGFIGKLEVLDTIKY